MGKRINNPQDYLEKREKQIFDAIWDIGQNGQAKDATRLKALLGLFNKIRPDKTKMEMDFKAEAPYQTLLNNLAKKK